MRDEYYRSRTHESVITSYSIHYTKLYEIGRVQLGARGFLEKFRDGVRLENRLLAVDLQHRNLGMRRHGQEPGRTVVAIDIGNLVGNFFLLQDDRRALNPGAGHETAEQELRSYNFV